MRPSAEPTKTTCARGWRSSCGSSAWVSSIGASRLVRSTSSRLRRRLARERPKAGTPAAWTTHVAAPGLGRGGHVAAGPAPWSGRRLQARRSAPPAGAGGRRAPAPADAHAPAAPAPVSGRAIAWPMPPLAPVSSTRASRGLHARAASLRWPGERRRLRLGQRQAAEHVAVEPEEGARRMHDVGLVAAGPSIRSISSAKCATCSRSSVPCERR